MYRPLLKKMGITYPQYLVLLVLWERGTSSVTDVGRALDLDSGTLTPLLKRMETSGLVVRKRGHKDERVVTVRLTDRGLALRKDASAVPLSLFRASGLSEKEIEALNKTIRQLTERIIKAQAE